MPSVEKIYKILELLKANYRTGLTNKQISEALKMPPSTCYRILAALKKYDIVYQRKPELQYVLGFSLLRYAEAIIDGMDISAVCLPYLEDIHNETEETTFFSLLNGRNCVVMEMCGFANMNISVGRGQIMPLYCSASGKAISAFLPKRERDRLLDRIPIEPFTKKTIVDRDELEKELETIRRRGISYCLQEFHNGINAMAVPVFSAGNRVLGSIAIVGTSVDLNQAQMDEYTELFIESAKEISERLGGTFPEASP